MLRLTDGVHRVVAVICGMLGVYGEVVPTYALWTVQRRDELSFGAEIVNDNA